jgi:hypothetical protein
LNRSYFTQTEAKILEQSGYLTVKLNKDAFGELLEKTLIKLPEPDKKIFKNTTNIISKMA